MLLIIGFAVVTISVIAGFVLSHGNLLTLWQPFELLIIGGSALGAFITANPVKVHKAVVHSILRAAKGATRSKESYLELLALLYELIDKCERKGVLSIEDDIETPHESEVFNKYPNLMKEHHVIDFICDYLRLITNARMNTFELEGLMELELSAHHKEAEVPSDAVTKVADALPGFGIVAAVLGIVVTMSYIGGDPALLGNHVAAALVGTFLGILLAYGFVGPVASAMEHVAREDAKFLECIKVCLMAYAQGYRASNALEFSRKVMYSTERPSFLELEDFIRHTRRASSS